MTTSLLKHQLATVVLLIVAVIMFSAAITNFIYVNNYPPDTAAANNVVTTVNVASFITALVVLMIFGYMAFSVLPNFSKSSGISSGGSESFPLRVPFAKNRLTKRSTCFY